MSNTSTTQVLIDDSIIDITNEEELLPWAKAQQPYFHVVNANGLNREGHAASKEELEARFPTATVTEWEPTEFVGIWML
jgi:hypothetical protein